MSKKSNNFVGCGHIVNVFSPETKEHIKVEGHVGLWYVIEEKYYENKGTLFLCEHETYGDEVACVIIDKDYNLILDEVWNGFDDYEEAVEWEKYKADLFSVLNTQHLKGNFTPNDNTQTVTLYRVKFEKEIYEVILLDTPIGKTDRNITFFYQGNKPIRYGVLEQKLKKHYNFNH